MDTRRDFLKKAALFSGATAMGNFFPPVIQKALSIDPAPGSSFQDAEHIVFLMQENRSFDHIFGSLQGVRGFNDPRAIRLPNDNRVWLQSNKDGDTFVPFRLNVNNTHAAWMGSLPHGWSDQTDARNEGRHDRWLEVKQAHKKDYAGMPLTLGYGERADFPFYYSLADAFTVCDQNFCSSITGTHPNRNYWMTGSIRENPADVKSLAHVWNVTNDFTPELNWTTFPERLEAAGIPWRIYQNELSLGFGLGGDEEEWLSNFGTNMLEYFKQYNIRLQPGRIANLQLKKEKVQQLMTQLETSTDDPGKQKLAAAKKLLAHIEADIALYTKTAHDQLSESDRALIEKAFTINTNDPHFHELTKLEYDFDGQQHTLEVPKGDIFHQFRDDVENGRLPAVSWLMSPGNLSDHPSVPWYGPAYVSEVMEILLKNPEVWKKTIFVLTYDENDGYFDHVPPFVPPNPYREHSGKVSPGIDPKMDYVTKEQQTNPSASADRLREAPLGLGYRVPMVIVSPWTRGGWVCSEVFDHTSSLQFLENFLKSKTGKPVHEPNITQWRRTICGDLSSAFRPYNGEAIDKPSFIRKAPFLEHINQGQFKDLPVNFKKLTAEEIAQINADPTQSPFFPKQEKGIRPSCPLPYELLVDGAYNAATNRYAIHFAAATSSFGPASLGAPFYAYAMRSYQSELMRTWNYAVAAGDALQDEWDVPAFEGGHYHLRVHGPNGFYREFKGDAANPAISISLTYEQSGNTLTGNIVAKLANTDTVARTVTITDLGYKHGSVSRTIEAGASAAVVLNLSKSHHWYDLEVKVAGFDNWAERFAGRVETGVAGLTDPLMGGVV
jgi:phospholipase C